MSLPLYLIFLFVNTFPLPLAFFHIFNFLFFITPYLWLSNSLFFYISHLPPFSSVLSSSYIFSLSLSYLSSTFPYTLYPFFPFSFSFQYSFPLKTLHVFLLLLAYISSSFLSSCLCLFDPVLPFLLPFHFSSASLSYPFSSFSSFRSELCFSYSFHYPCLFIIYLYFYFLLNKPFISLLYLLPLNPLNFSFIISLLFLCLFIFSLH